MAALDGRARTAETYLAGLGATGALVAGAVVVFLLLVGIVTFDAWPRAAGLFAGSEPSVEAVDSSGPAATAAETLAGASDLVAAVKRGTSLSDAPGGQGDSGGQGNGIDGGGRGVSDPAPSGTDPSPTGGGGGSSGGGQGGTGEPVQDTGTTVDNTVNNTVTGVTDTVNNTVTGVNDTLNNTLDGVDSLLKGLTGG